MASEPSAASTRSAPREPPLETLLTTSAGVAPCQQVALSVVAPVYGCVGCLEDLVDRIESAVAPLVNSFEVILVDDAGPGDPWSRILELAETRPWIRGIRLSRNFGQHNAITAGLSVTKGSRVVVMDCDLQDPPEAIAKLLAAADRGFDVVFARRLNRRDNVVKKFLSWVFYRVLTWLTQQPHDHSTANFGVFSRRVVDAVVAMPESERFFPSLVRWTGYSMTNVDVQHSARSEGRTGYSICRLLGLAMSVMLAYSDRPLRFVVAIGAAFSLIAFGLVGLALYLYFKGEIQVAGYTSVIASIWLVGGAVIACLGVIGLYVGRIFLYSKKRPHYLIADIINNSSVPVARPE